MTINRHKFAGHLIGQKAGISQLGMGNVAGVLLRRRPLFSGAASSVQFLLQGIVKLHLFHNTDNNG